MNPQWKYWLFKHADFAVYALVSLSILGVAALIGLFIALSKSSLSRTIAMTTLVIAFVSFGLIAWTGYLGGQIRHTELNASNPTQIENGENEKDD